jgi:hypothetical protein
MEVVHLVDKSYGTLSNENGKSIGRIACVKDPYQRLNIKRVNKTKRGVTCKRCLKTKNKD